jgi:DNA-binding IclR family transcriptional regulator
MTSSAYPGTQAILRAVALLKAFTDVRPEWELADLARTVKLNKTTAYRLLTALESEGLVARERQAETYRLGPEAIALGWRALRSNDLHSAGHAELEALGSAVGETATLEVLVNSEVLILDEVQGRHLVGTLPFVGTHWPAHATSTGKVLLAHSDDAERTEILRFPLPKLTSQTITTLTALRAELARVREQGYAVAREELEEGFVAVGAPVRDHRGQVIAAISVGGPSIRLTGKRIAVLAESVVQAAARISQRLGYTGS